MEPANETNPTVDETEERLIEALTELEEEVEKQNSLSYKFISGALYGLGTVIGATVLLAIFGSVVAVIVRMFGIEHIPFIGSLIEQAVVEQVEQR